MLILSIVQQGASGKLDEQPMLVPETEKYRNPSRQRNLSALFVVTSSSRNMLQAKGKYAPQRMFCMTSTKLAIDMMDSTLWKRCVL